jgi:hypothetical protein
MTHTHTFSVENRKYCNILLIRNTVNYFVTMVFIFLALTEYFFKKKKY